MRVKSNFLDGTLRLRFEPDDDDKSHLNTLNFSMDENLEVFVKLGEGSKEPHPELVALSTILICNPFVGKRLSLPVEVSEKFHDIVSSVISRYRIMKKTADIDTIDLSNNLTPSLAFSAGADSTAALSVMPGNTVPIFLLRPQTSDSHYDSSAALQICDELKSLGYEIMIIESNLEMLRVPVGFPTDLANSVPAILLSESLGLGSISFGTVLESGYGIGHEKFREYGEGSHWRFFNTIFESVGLKLSMPVMGISEVGTGIICEKSPYGHYSQSCIRGKWLKPCMKCWKCFRKELLAVGLGFSEETDIKSMLKSNEVQKKLSEFPISHENVIIYSLQRINLESYNFLKPLASKLDMALDMGFLETWYYPAIKFVPDTMRSIVRENISNFLPPITPEGEEVLLTWNMTEHLLSKKARTGQERLTSFWQDF